MTPDDVMHAMRRLASTGETDVSPIRVADLISPRPSAGAMSRVLEQLWEDGLLDHARIGIGRYCLAPVPYAEEQEQMTFSTTKGGQHGR